MGWSAARKLRRGIDGLTRVLAIELLTAAAESSCACRCNLRPRQPQRSPLSAPGAHLPAQIAGSHPRSRSPSS